MSGLAGLNDAPPDEAAALLGTCCAAPDWVAAMLAARPFPDGASVTSAGAAALAGLDWGQIRTALDAHPRIGERLTGDGTEAAWSAREQSGMRSATDETRSAIVAANHAYEERFGHVFLICATVAAQLWPRATLLPATTVQDVVSVALAIILFDGGMHIGWRRFRGAAAAIVWVGVAGTLVTAAGASVAAHFAAGMGWRLSLLLGTAVAATDPAVVFSVFGRRESAGRTGVLLEGESGANDPVGIALLAALLAAHGSAGAVAWHVITEFVLQMAVGTAIGVAGGLALLAFMRRIPLPSEGLYSPRVLAGVLVIFGLAVVAQGSGFLAVFVAGILIGDEPAPYKREIQRFHSSLASLAEIVAFVLFFAAMFALNWKFMLYFLPFYYFGHCLSYLNGYYLHLGGNPDVPIAWGVSSYHKLYNWLWFNNGYISSISETGHVRLPDFSDAYLVDNQLYLSPPDGLLAQRPIGVPYGPPTGPYDQSR